MTASFYVENFGCRATQADGAAIERQFEERGLVRASAPARSEIVVLNTCTVTASADQDARAAIRRIRRENPGCQIVVTGCYAQRASEEVASLPGVTCVVGNSHKHRLAEIALPNVFARSARNKHLQEGREWGGHDLSRAVTAAHSPASAAEGSPRGHMAAFVPLASLASKGWEPEAGARIFVSDIFAHTELVAAPVFDLLGDARDSQRTRPNL